MKSVGLGLACLLSVGLYLLIVFGSPAPVVSAPITIAVSTTPLSTPFILADKYDLFGKHGLQVQIKPYHGGHRCFNALMNREVDLATSSESVVMYNAFKRNDFSIIATFVTSDNDIKLTAKRGSGIESLQDVKNLRVGMIKTSASEYFFHSALVLSGIESQGISSVYLAPEELGQALKDDRVDLVSLWEPYAHQLAGSLKDQGVQLSTKGLYRLSFNLVARRDQAQSDRNTHAALFAALAEAIEIIHRRPDEAKKVVSDYLGVDRQELDAYWPDYHFQLGLDKTLQLELISQAHWAISSGYVDQNAIPDFRDFIDESALYLLNSSKNGRGGTQ